MGLDVTAERNPGSTSTLAQWSCALFGAGLLAWGLTPMIVQRITSHQAPEWEAIATQSMNLMLGLTFVALGQLIRRGTAWALWAAAGLALFLLLGMLTGAVLGYVSRPALFPLLLATSTVITCVLAIAARRLSGAPRAAPPGS
jgi:hypothetical protein